MNYFYHFSSIGKESKDLTVSREDFIAMNNRIAICQWRSGLRICAFNIEDSHIHVLGYGKQEQAEIFRAQMESMTRRYCNATRDYPPEFELNYYTITDSPSTLASVAAYVVIQSTKDGLKTMYYDYPWSSGPLYFRANQESFKSVWIDHQGELIGSSLLSKRQLKAITRTSEGPYPQTWEVFNNMIMPWSFVDIELYESIFKTHNAFRVFAGMRKNADSAILDSIMLCSGTSLEDREIRTKAIQLSTELYKTSNLRALSASQRFTIARRLRKQYSIGHAQLSRILHVPEEELKKYVR